MRRRTALRLVGFGAVGTLAGCIGDGTDDDGTGPEIANTATIQLATRSSRPLWKTREGERTGHAVLIDSEGRTEAVLNQYAREMPEDRTVALGEFMERVDFRTDRLLVVESAGPNRCYDRVEVENLGVEDGRLRAEATAVDTGDDEECAEEIAYPSVMVRVTFEAGPLDEAAVSVTDGWGDTATVSASAADSLSPDPVDLPGHIRPEGEAEPVDPLDCRDEEFVRLPQAFEEEGIRMGDLERDGEVILSMRTAAREYERGDTVGVELTNVSEGEVTTGSWTKYNLQVFTSDGWRDVRGSDDGDVMYTDEGVVHYPGGGFEWTFELTGSGVVENGPDELRVCPRLPAGRYRFAFWGLTDGESGALAVEFDLLD